MQGLLQWREGEGLQRNGKDQLAIGVIVGTTVGEQPWDR